MKRFISSLIAIMCVFSFICITDPSSTALAESKIKLPTLQFINAADQLQQSLLQKIESQKAKTTLTITGASYPKPGSTHKKGKSFELKGLIKSNEIIHDVYGLVYDANTYEIKLGLVQISPATKSVQIYNTRINTGLKFGKLPVGTYTLLIGASTAEFHKELIKSTFYVK